MTQPRLGVINNNFSLISSLPPCNQVPRLFPTLLYLLVSGEMAVQPVRQGRPSVQGIGAGVPDLVRVLGHAVAERKR